ncbi:helix-turn-helix transcriptional regulator [Nonomuraea sp. NPDC050663]|uniref:helix-turn-helix transcriptional regulator n=1 Tax=Nonomuraea sp. NPDC050663 TaxID=3364370 RepID=UPI0037AD4495
MANPTLLQLQLGRRLRELRQEAGLSIAEAADRVLLSPAQVSRIETGQRRASLRDVRALSKLYEFPEEELMELAKQARETEWWHRLEARDLRMYIGLENEAAAISYYGTTTLHGLVQTEEYARAVIKGYLPRITDTALEERVRTRMKRQEILERVDPPKFWVMLDECAIHRMMGGAQVMGGQLRRLSELSERPNITVLIVPFSAGAHMALDSAFQLLEFDQAAPGLTDTVFMETLAGDVYLQKAERVKRFREVLDHLRAMALNPHDSRNMILRKLRDL